MGRLPSAAHEWPVYTSIAVCGRLVKVRTMYPSIQTRCFKAYDIRGQVPADLNEDVAYRIGRALVAELGGKRYVVVSVVNHDRSDAVRAFDDALIKWLAER